MTTITLQNPSSQKEDLPVKSTTITLSPAARHGKGIEYMPGYHHYPGINVGNKAEAEILPEGATKLTGNLVPPDQTFGLTTYSRIPWMLGDRVCMRTVASRMEENTGRVEDIVIEDTLRRSHRLYGDETSFAAAAGKDYALINKGPGAHPFPPAYQEIEIDGKPGIIFTQNHVGREPLLHYYCDGDWRVIQKLKKLYCESHGLEMTESPATPSVLGQVLERVRKILGK